MTADHLLYAVFVCTCLWFGWWLAHRRPWDGKLHGWKLDRAVRRAKRKHGYWPLPHKWTPEWRRPPKPQSYCLRCGRWPFKGPEIMYEQKAGLMTICHLCACVCTVDEMLRYVHQVLDIKICQNFDWHFIHPDSREPMTAYFAMWSEMARYVMTWSQDRG